MSNSEPNIQQLILNLEGIKNNLTDCDHKSQLIDQVDNAMETLINAQNIGIISKDGELVTRLRYLRELRASALDLSEEQVRDFSRDFSLIVSSMQFQLWQGGNKELIELLEQGNQ